MAAHTEVRQRLLLFAGILLLWLAAIAGRLVYLQVIRYGDFVQRAQKQQQRTIEVAAPRGVIYDRNGRELATDDVRALGARFEPFQNLSAHYLLTGLRMVGT